MGEFPGVIKTGTEFVLKSWWEGITRFLLGFIYAGPALILYEVFFVKAWGVPTGLAFVALLGVTIPVSMRAVVWKKRDELPDTDDLDPRTLGILLLMAIGYLSIVVLLGASLGAALHAYAPYALAASILYPLLDYEMSLRTYSPATAILMGLFHAWFYLKSKIRGGTVGGPTPSFNRATVSEATQRAVKPNLF